LVYAVNYYSEYKTRGNLPASTMKGFVRLKTQQLALKTMKNIENRTELSPQSSCSVKYEQTCIKSSLGNVNKSGGGGATITDSFGELSEDVNEVRDDEVSDDKRVFLGACLTIKCGVDCAVL
jgi:hypothetical protein